MKDLKPHYPNDKIRQLSEALEDAYQRKERLVSAGKDSQEVDEEILELRRRIREGDQLNPGDFLLDGRFKLLEPLGHGGFATVFRAYDRRARRSVAVKALHGQFVEDRTYRERFSRGARKMAELQHQGIVRVLEEVWEDGGYLFFVMEYVSGGDLHRAVLEGRLDREEILRIIREVGEALHFAHQHGVFHRDVKPANVLLDHEGAAKLTDFDLVRAFDTTGGTRTEGLLGTFLFAAPEALQNPKEAAAAADVYSLGMTAVFALHGAELPLTVIQDTEAFARGLRSSASIRAAVLKAIAWDPDARYRSVANFCRALRTATRSGRRPEEPTERVHEVDGTVLVYVPGGELALGAGDLDEDCRPVHRVVLSPFWIAKYPVTNEQYAKFLQANPDFPRPAHWGAEELKGPLQPVVGVSWEAAAAYCQWTELALPSEAQWEAAARGTDQRRYPWGNEEPSPQHANFRHTVGATTPVAAYPAGAGPHGTLGQAGNVWEWCADAWDPEAYKAREGTVDPLCTPPGDRDRRVLRGGSWGEPAGLLRASFRDRHRTSYRSKAVGFRCVLPVHFIS